MAQGSTIKDIDIHVHQEKSYLKFIFIDDSTISIPMNSDDGDKLSKIMETRFKEFLQ